MMTIFLRRIVAAVKLAARVANMARDRWAIWEIGM
jgi:hypothetical protein